MRLRSWLGALAGTLTLTGGGALATPPTTGPGGPAAPTAPSVVSDQDLAAAFGPGVRVVRAPFGGAVRALYGLDVATTGATPTARAQAFVEASRAAIGLGRAETTTFTAEETQALPSGGHVVRFTQTWQGLPVESRSLAVKLDAAGRVRSLTSDIVALALARPGKTIAASEAKAIVASSYEVALVGAPREVVLATAPGIARVALRVPCAVIPLQSHFFVWLDAETGAVLHEAPAGHDNPITHLPKKGGAR